MESIFRGVQHAGGSGHFLGTKPILVFVDGKPVPESCKATHTSVDDLNSAMRKAGAPAEVDDSLSRYTFCSRLRFCTRLLA